MIFDHRSLRFHHWRENLSTVVYPIQRIVDTPIKFTHWLASSVIAQHQLVDENARLRAHQLLLESKLQKLLVLERENMQLKELLRSTSHLSSKVKVAQLLAVDLNPALQQLILNMGGQQGVYVGQPVLDAYGVMGQVVDVGPIVSKVLLITDRRSAIPVQDYRNGLRAVAVGLGASRRLTLINIGKTVDIKVGDLFVASGLGLRYPVGYPVGVVDKIARLPGYRFMTVLLLPSAHLDQTQQVLLAWPSKASLTRNTENMLKKPLLDAGQS